MGKEDRNLRSALAAGSGKPVGLTVHSRFEDGGHAVQVLPVGFQVQDTGAIYTSARSLIRSLTDHPKARNWSFDRYFKLGHFAPPAPPEPLEGASILDIFGAPGLTVAPSVPSAFRHLVPGLTVAPPPPAPRKLGIDLERRSKEVQKLLFHGFGSRIFAAGYDPDDVLQEVYRGILRRNQGTCPWDERKSSFGHYVHMVCECILSNYHRRESRRRSVEQVGLSSPGGEGKETDVSEVAADSQAMFQSGPDTPAWVQQDLVAHLRSNIPLGRGPDVRLAIRLLPLLQQGLNRAEMAASLNVPKTNVSRAVTLLKERARDWGMRH